MTEDQVSIVLNVLQKRHAENGATRFLLEIAANVLSASSGSGQARKELAKLWYEMDKELFKSA